MKKMSTHIGGIGVFPGSFNPPHIGHIKTIRLALECFDILHIFVRYNEGVDLVDWDTKRLWFDRINEEVGGHLVIHKMENKAITGKSYTMEDYFDFMRSVVQSVGEPVSGFVFGDDYENLLPEFRKEFPRMFFFKGERPSDGELRLSSTDIRKDLEGHRSWLPEYVYETLHQMRENAIPKEQARPRSAQPEEEGTGDMKIPDLASCPVLGNGFGSTVYGLDEKIIVKVYKEGTPREKVQKEYELSRTAFQSGVPSVRAYRLVQVKGAFGLVLERLFSSLGSEIHNHPEQTEMYVDQYAALAKKLHSTRVPDDTVPAIRDMWLSWSENLSKWCTPDEVSLVCNLITRMPDADTFLHGDLHPGNIMFRGNELVLIDMAALARGSYLCDLAVIYRGLIMGPQSPNVAKREKNMGMSAQQIREVGDLFFMRYLGIEHREELEKVYERLHLLYALSVVVMCGNGRMKDDSLARLLMDRLLRSVVMPGKDKILEIWQDGELVPGVCFTNGETGRQ